MEGPAIWRGVRLRARCGAWSPRFGDNGTIARRNSIPGSEHGIPRTGKESRRLVSSKCFNHSRYLPPAASTSPRGIRTRGATRTLIRYYAKRWGIETSFRDIKDMRFGMGLSAMRVSNPERRDRMLLLSALAIALLTLLGAAGESLGYDRWLKANTVKYRTHSLFRQGLMLYEHIPNWPDHRLRPLMEKFARMITEQRVHREVFGVI